MKNTRLLLFGTLAGLLNILFWFLLDRIFQDENFDFSLGEILGYAAMLIALSMVFLGVKEHRDKQLNGRISFKGAFLKGLVIVLVASIIYVIGWEIYYPNFQADFGEKYADYIATSLEESGLSAEEIATEKQNMQEWMEKYKNPLYRIPITLSEILPVGLLVTFISALLLKKK